MRTILLLAIMILSVNAADVVEFDLTKVEMPPRVQKADERLSKDLAKAAEEYAEAVADAKERAIREIEKELKRNRDPLVAMALEVKKEEVTALGAKDMLGNPIVAKGETPTFNPVGKWMEQGQFPYELLPDGKVDRGGKCFWRIEDGKLHLGFPSGNSCLFEIGDDPNYLEGPNGIHSLTRVIE